MEFGRVSEIASLNLSLPADHERSAAVLAKGRGGGRERLYVGCPIWNDAALARKLPAEGAPSSDKLALYAHSFNSVELNASGYGLEAGNAARWAALTPPGFLFCPKVPMEVSHSRS